MDTLFKTIRQVILVQAQDWNTIHGMLSFYERKEMDLPWKELHRFPVVLGKNGMAWGRGLYEDTYPCNKCEGDMKSPAGVFTLGKGFGNWTPNPIQWPFLEITPSLEAIDDPKSLYYNHIVNRERCKKIDWNSSEKMAEEPLYELGLVINHNLPNPLMNAGSAIFMHLWRSENEGTAGCTAMSKENMLALLKSLKPEFNPLLIQLPKESFHAFLDSIDGTLQLDKKE